jgi:predicted nucleotidyltransferase
LYFEKIIEKFSGLNEVEAIALGGSRATGANDKKSDYDIYVYTTDEISVSTKRDILSECCDIMEISNHYWELEDNCIMKDGIEIDIIYRSIDRMSNFIGEVVEKHTALNGYTTCFWHNVVTCKVLFDRNGRLQAMKERFTVPYPQELKKNIIKRNMNLLSGCLPSYDKQIAKTVARGDFVSVNHRLAAFLESYFDIIFALNEKTHPGEKRLVEMAKKQCEILPKDFEENLDELFKAMYTENMNEVIKRIYSELKLVVDKNS